MKDSYQITERQLEAYRLRKMGLSYAKIGEKIGVSRDRARILANRASRRKQYHAEGERGHPLYGFCFRIQNALITAGIRNRQDLLAAYKSGELLNIRWIGWDSYIQISEWLGMPTPTKGGTICPHCGKAFVVKRKKK